MLTNKISDYSSVDLSWENVSVDVHMKRGVLCFQKDLGRKQILENGLFDLLLEI